MLFIGIDPGLTGAIAVINDAGEVESVFDTPTAAVEKSNGKGKKNIYLVAQMVELFAKIRAVASETDPIRTVGLERINAMPGQGVTSMFSMGYGFGLWQGIIAAIGLPLELVTPQSWKKSFLLGPDKKQAVVKCQQLIPESAQYLTLVKHHGRAEAFLIAEFFRRKYERP